MKFTSYDNVNKNSIDRTKTWINPKYKQIFSAEVKYDKYFQIIRKFDSNTDNYTYFVAFMDNQDDDNHKCRIDELGRTRFSISSIWNEINGDNIKYDVNVNLEYEETIEGADVFRIDFDKYQ